MGLSKYLSSIFVNKNQYQFKNTRNIQMILGCWLLGFQPIYIFPNLVRRFDGSLEMLPPVIFMTTFVCIPFTFFILGISQYSKKGWVQLWQAAPAWNGIGIIGIFNLYVSSIYNASVCTYFLYYTIRSLETVIPWLECGAQRFEIDGCYTLSQNRSIRLDCIYMHNEEHCSNIDWKTSAEYFLDNSVKFRRQEGGFRYNYGLVPYQVAVLVMVYVRIRNSTASLAIFSRFLLIIPTILHGILLVRSFLHPGSLRALEKLCSFKSSNFLDMSFWFDIGSMSIFSSGVAYGGLSNIGMYYSFRNPINIDAVFSSVASVTYSIMYTVLVYNTFGILSHELNVPIERLITMKTDPNFIQCPMSFTHLSLTKFWTFVFFLSNFLVTFRVLATKADMFLCMFYDWKPMLRSYTIPCALTFCHIHLFWCILSNFQLFEEFITELYRIIVNNAFPALGFYLYILIDFFYGVSHFVDDMHFMLGYRPSNLWKLNWYLGFSINLVLFIYSVYTFELECNLAIYYILLTVMFVVCLFPLVYFLIFGLVKCRKNVTWTEIRTIYWGPKDEVLRKSREMFSAYDMTKEYLYRQQRLKFKTTDPSLSKINTTVDVNL